MVWLTSAVIAALVSALFSVLIAERRIAAENVIQERKNWRDKIRELASEVHEAFVGTNDAKLRELQARFSLLVNPHDSQDQEILALITAAHATPPNEFAQRVALLLKHDWERAKRKASLWRRLWEQPPARVPFAAFQPGVEHQYRRAWLTRQ